MGKYDGRRFDPAAPVAQVTLEGRGGTRDVELLIDTGADVSLLPKGPAFEAGERTGSYHGLEGFEGSKIEVESVYVSIIFLGKRFRGEFVAVDQQVGILGRDLLSRVAIVLDGPAGEWREQGGTT